MKKVILVDESNSVEPQNLETIIADRNQLVNFLQKSEFSPSVNFMKELPNLRIDDKSIKEWFRYCDISLWWFVHPRIWPRIEQCIRFVDGFEILIQSFKPDVIEVRGFYEYVEIISQICEKNGLKFSLPFSSKINILAKKINEKFRKLIVQSNLVSKRKERIRRNLGNKAYSKLSGLSQGGVIHVSFQTYRTNLYDIKTGRVKRGEHLVQKILDLVKKKTNLLCIDLDSTAKGDFKVLRERLEENQLSWIPLEVFFTNEVNTNCKKPIENVKNNLRTLFKNKEFQKKFSYKNINFWKTIDYYFETLLAYAYVPNYIKCIEASKLLLKRIKPRTIFIVYERGPYSLAFNVAANNLGIQSIGLQHGIIDKHDHIYAIKDLNIGDSELSCPIPTKMMVFGDYYKQLLVNGSSYPKDRLIVVGYPPFDGIADVKTLPQKNEILKNLSLDVKKRIILVATSRFQRIHGSEDYDVLMVKTLIEKLGNDENFQVIIKPHPRENINVYKKIIEEKNISNFNIAMNPIQQILLVCDVFVTVMTTAVLEAIVLNKPVVMVKISENIDFDYLSLVKSGAVIESNLDNLANNLNRVLEDKELLNKLNENGKKVVKNHFNHPSSGINEKIAETLVSDQ